MRSPHAILKPRAPIGSGLPFQDIYEQAIPRLGPSSSRSRYSFWASDPRPSRLKDAARNRQRHRDASLRWFTIEKSPTVLSRGHQNTSCRPPRLKARAAIARSAISKRFT